MTSGVPTNGGIDRAGEGVRVSLHDSIHEFAREEWNPIAGREALASHGWLATAEATFRGAFRRVLVAARLGPRLVAVAAGQVVDEGPVETLDDRLFGRVLPVAAALRVSFQPSLVCGPLRGGGVSPLLAPDLRGVLRERVLAAVVDAIEDWAARHSLPTCFVGVRPKQAEIRNALGGRGYLHAVDSPASILDVEWRSFDEYLRHLDGVSRGARSDVRRQINQNRKRGTAIVALDDPAPHEARLHELMEGNERIHNRRPFAFAPGFFTALKESVGADATIYAAVKQERVTAVALMLRHGDEAHLPMVGVDHAACDNDFTYFNIAHYRPIADAIDAGIRRLHFGSALYELKARRGCHLEESLVFVRPRTRIGAVAAAAWMSGLSAWNRAKVPRRARAAERPERTPRRAARSPRPS